MYSYKKKPSSTSSSNNNQSICFYILTILVICSLFIFAMILSHSTLDSHEPINKAFVVNNLEKWILTESKKDIETIVNFEQSIYNKSKNEIYALEAYVAKSIIEHINHKDESILSTTSPLIIDTDISQQQQHTPSPNILNQHNEIPHDIPSSLPYHELKCEDDFNADILKFWKPTTNEDRLYRSPYSNPFNVETKYVTFEPDVGGWNNIRMQMELVLVFAYATGRTLVLPPDQPMYLLNKGQGHQKAHSFADFFPFDYISTRMHVISMQEFMQREAITGKLRNSSTHKVEYPPQNKTVFDGTEREQRLQMWDYLRSVGSCPKWSGLKEFLIIPPGPGINITKLPSEQAKPYLARRELMGAGRSAVYYDDYWHQQRLIHFISKPGLGYRLLEHFYTFIYFDDIPMDRYYKRFIRDYVHYIDIIFCKAALIINKLLTDGHGSYSSFHIRRGEFQYKEVKIPAEKILNNVGQFIPANQLIFIATDERNKSFFNAFKSRWPQIKYLDDFMDYAQLKNINPNFLGMIDQVVCTRGDVFVGTWFSTFSGYITRMRGYLGYSDSTVYYGDKPHRDRFQHHELPKFPFYMREWNISWYLIDN